MKASTSLSLLALAAIASPLLAFWPQDPDPAATDWASHVEKACTAKRYGIRLAAARKVAEGGDAAVPAVRAWAGKHGANALPAALVDAIADGSANAPGVRDLLEQWATDQDFYWRASAMRGLALRMPTLPDGRNVGTPDPRERYVRLFERHLDDPAWLMRTHARLGVVLSVGSDVALARRARNADEPDPRARVRFAQLMLEHGKTPDLQPLLDALADERTFLEDPWGARLGLEAHKALKSWLGDDYPGDRDAALEDKDAAIAAITAAAGAKSNQRLTVPTKQTDRQRGVAGGVEILSCKHGDRFVQWTDDGRMWFGIDAGREVRIGAEAWDALARDRAALALEGNLGVVICDSMRVRLDGPGVHVKVAPESLPAAATEWLQRLARAVEEAGEKGLAADLRRSLAQFAAP